MPVLEGAPLEQMSSRKGRYARLFFAAYQETYVRFQEASLPLLAPNGLIVADNVLWRGRVLAPENDEDQAVIDFADHVQRDPRVTNVTLTAGDGLMVIRRRDGA
jgi:caffeoyl-CoA O-methyltransferase